MRRGKSGNRNGRPVQPSPEIDFRKVLLIELTRLVTIPSTRGKVPAIQAVVRGAILSAVKGNSRSQHEVLEMYRQICREQEVLRDVVQAYFARHRRQGRNHPAAAARDGHRDTRYECAR